MAPLTQSIVEDAALAWLEATGWKMVHDPDIAPNMPAAERVNYGEVILVRLASLNPDLPAEALEDAFRKLSQPERAKLIQRNRALAKRKERCTT